MLSFNYRSDLLTGGRARWRSTSTLVVDHYLKQFNEETIAAKQQHTCGEPCAAVCKKMRDEFKKDYEPYQTMGPLCGIFDQRAAERADAPRGRARLRRDLGRRRAVLADGVPARAGARRRRTSASSDAPVFAPEGFRVVEDSAHNADARRRACSTRSSRSAASTWRRGRGGGRGGWRRVKGRQVLDSFVHTAFARKGWMVPNQYWTPGALAPMPIMGKYYMYYGPDFLPPRQLGRMNAERMVEELVLDNLGICRFHRGWAEDMGAEIVEALYGRGKEFVEKVKMTASRINSRNSSVFWEAGRNADLVLRVPQAPPRRRAGSIGRSWTSGSRASRRTGARPRSTSGTRCTRARTSRCWSSEGMENDEWRMEN